MKNVKIVFAPDICISHIVSFSGVNFPITMEFYTYLSLPHALPHNHRCFYFMSLQVMLKAAPSFLNSFHRLVASVMVEGRQRGDKGVISLLLSYCICTL